MYKDLLSKKFFNENPIKKYSAQNILFEQISNPALDQYALDTVRKYDQRAEKERAQLQEENDPNTLLQMLRGKCDNLCHDILYEKVLANEEIMIPKMLPMFKKSLNDEFIESTVKILTRTKHNYSKVLLKMLDEIRSPYAVSLACIVLGFIAGEEAIPVLMEKYEQLKKHFPNEGYMQGPVLGMCNLNNRFYSKKDLFYL